MLPAMPESTGQGKRRIGHRGWTGISIVSGLVALAFFPVVFGPVSILGGVMVLRRFDEYHGLALVAFGLLTTVVGFILGVQSAMPT